MDVDLSHRLERFFLLHAIGLQFFDDEVLHWLAQSANRGDSLLLRLPVCLALQGLPLRHLEDLAKGTFAEDANDLILAPTVCFHTLSCNFSCLLV